MILIMDNVLPSFKIDGQNTKSKEIVANILRTYIKTSFDGGYEVLVVEIIKYINHIYLEITISMMSLQEYIFSHYKG